VGKVKEAEDAFRRAERLEPHLAAAYFNHGLLYLDHEIEGMDKIKRLEAAISMLGRYRDEMGLTLPKDDPVDKYVGEARKLIDLEKKRLEKKATDAAKPKPPPDTAAPAPAPVSAEPVPAGGATPVPPPK